MSRKIKFSELVRMILYVVFGCYINNINRFNGISLPTSYTIFFMYFSWLLRVIISVGTYKYIDLGRKVK